MRRALVFAPSAVAALGKGFSLVCPRCAKRGVLICIARPGNLLPLPKARRSRLAPEERSILDKELARLDDPRQLRMPGT